MRVFQWYLELWTRLTFISVDGSDHRMFVQTLVHEEMLLC
jgi:hypothetical protein